MPKGKFAGFPRGESLLWFALPVDSVAGTPRASESPLCRLPSLPVPFGPRPQAWPCGLFLSGQTEASRVRLRLVIRPRQRR